ncbi:uncharacterized protein AMSG_08444 [Thecamonas trahens ATCC 50062]|uniref:Uncharacterized protein n=1 Tax=Thecamonas trahens ATCC 50062 TaxID=461836 RepID=A0A0L0DJX3_THETB|nr:hypothetical protein AMSG_08444 [Thecamonas trahens ATCC 50062]KNC52582.1 hypothetical protein AMSG_08444 [Thecamonas trahens ATCC 50062]|eukprot:XP_013755142.1 hypothetical protein AMSG_08444 [Thecamonas trahens ATCC 50062]
MEGAKLDELPTELLQRMAYLFGLYARDVAALKATCRALRAKLGSNGHALVLHRALLPMAQSLAAGWIDAAEMRLARMDDVELAKEVDKVLPALLRLPAAVDGGRIGRMWPRVFAAACARHGDSDDAFGFDVTPLPRLYVSKGKGARALSLLEMASWHGHADAVSDLLSEGVQPPIAYRVRGRERYFVYACMGGHVRVVQRVVEDGRGVADATRHNTGLTAAARSGHLAVVELLVDGGWADLGHSDCEAFRLATEAGQSHVVAWMLGRAEVDPGARYSYALGMAASGGHADVVELLLADGRSNPGDDDSYCLVKAVLNGHAGVVRSLLREAARS